MCTVYLTLILLLLTLQKKHPAMKAHFLHMLLENYAQTLAPIHMHICKQPYNLNAFYYKPIASILYKSLFPTQLAGWPLQTNI